MRILIDDMRLVLPNGSLPDVIFRNYKVAEYYIVSFPLRASDTYYMDHDLGEGGKTGYDLMCIIEERIMIEEQFVPEAIICVSDNGPGRERIEAVIKKIYGYLPR